MSELKPVFIAHRGYAAAYPENTLVALEAARQAGAKFIEVDIQLTSDHIPVLFHDMDLQRLCQVNGAIHDYSFSQLEKFNVTDFEKFGNKYADNKITSLSDFIEYLKKHVDLIAFIELKRSMISAFGERKVLDALLPLFEGMSEQIIFISYEQNILKNIHNSSDYKTGVVVNDWQSYNKNSDWQPEWLFCAVAGLPLDDTELDIKSRIAVFEVGKVELAKQLLEKGICYLETFCIKEMLEAFSINDNA